MIFVGLDLCVGWAGGLWFVLIVCIACLVVYVDTDLVDLACAVCVLDCRLLNGFAFGV